MGREREREIGYVRRGGRYERARGMGRGGREGECARARKISPVLRSLFLSPSR